VACEESPTPSDGRAQGRSFSPNPNRKVRAKRAPLRARRREAYPESQATQGLRTAARYGRRTFGASSNTRARRRGRASGNNRGCLGRRNAENGGARRPRRDEDSRESNAHAQASLTMSSATRSATLAPRMHRSRSARRRLPADARMPDRSRAAPRVDEEAAVQVVQQGFGDLFDVVAHAEAADVQRGDHLRQLGPEVLEREILGASEQQPLIGMRIDVDLETGIKSRQRGGRQRSGRTSTEGVTRHERAFLRAQRGGLPERPTPSEDAVKDRAASNGCARLFRRKSSRERRRRATRSDRESLHRARSEAYSPSQATSRPAERSLPRRHTFDARPRGRGGRRVAAERSEGTLDHARKASQATARLRKALHCPLTFGAAFEDRTRCRVTDGPAQGVHHIDGTARGTPEVAACDSLKVSTRWY